MGFDNRFWLLISMILSIVNMVKSDETGYNSYNPKSGNAYTKPTHDPKNFDDVFPSTTPGSSSQRAAYAAASNCFKTGGGKVPEYYICRGNGDYMGHKQQKYCQTDVAQHCLDDLRNNRSHNIHTNCSYNVDKVYCNASSNFQANDDDGEKHSGSCWVKKMKKNGMQLLSSQNKTKGEWNDCCPILDGNYDDFLSSSAYPDALMCLKRANCEGERIYTDLKAECEERCCSGSCYYPRGDILPEYDSSTYTVGGPCSPSTPSSAFRSPPLLFLYALISVSVSMMLM
jgi:hypothetical protein